MIPEPSYLVLDLETVDDDTNPPEPPKEGKEPAFPAPFHHRILCMGIALLRRTEENTLALVSAGVYFGERKSVTSFKRLTQRSVVPIVVTWNGRGFDLPVIASRAFALGISLPWYFRPTPNNPRYRFARDSAWDLMDDHCSYGSAPRSKLGAVAKAMGLVGKTGSGASVADMHKAGDLDAIGAYCLDDARLTTFILARSLLLRGEMTPEEYNTTIRGFLLEPGWYELVQHENGAVSPRLFAMVDDAAT